MNKNKYTILIADDDPAILDALQIMLEDEGYNTLTTVDGKVLEIMNERKIDLLLLDIWMSGMDGRDICKRLKNDPETKKVPIIMVSANRDTKEISLESGADDFISKPFEMNELLELIQKFLKK